MSGREFVIDSDDDDFLPDPSYNTPVATTIIHHQSQLSNPKPCPYLPPQIHNKPSATKENGKAKFTDSGRSSKSSSMGSKSKTPSSKFDTSYSKSGSKRPSSSRTSVISSAQSFSDDDTVEFLSNEDTSDYEYDVKNDSVAYENKLRMSQRRVAGKRRRRLLNENELQESTRRAFKEERARLKRLEERQYVRQDSRELDVQTTSKVVLEFDGKSGLPLIQVHPKIADNLKSHQIEAVRFLWTTLCESVHQMKKGSYSGSGAIIAHSMGLGKTLSTIAFVHALLTKPDTGINTCLILAPLNAQLNWVAEFRKWIPEDYYSDIDVYHITDLKSMPSRAVRIQKWLRTGGVMVMGYTMYKQLVTAGQEDHNMKGKKRRKLSKMTKSTFFDALVRPGPSLVICDEGHVLKSEKTVLSQAVRQIETRRRIILTGTPLQNNLMEYHCMVSFVKPGLLGTTKEFSNRFVTPIKNGELLDATAIDVRIMKRRISVLHRLLAGFVHRRGPEHLRTELPPKYEFVVLLRSTPEQSIVYSNYLRNVVCITLDDMIEEENIKRLRRRLFADYHLLRYVCFHPYLLYVARKNAELEEEKIKLRTFYRDSETTSDESSESAGGIENTRVQPVVNYPGNNNEEKQTRHTLLATPTTWFDSVVDEGTRASHEISSKIMITMELLRSFEDLDEKTLIFSQSLLVLNLLEKMLEVEQKNRQNSCHLPYSKWKCGVDFSRIDGSSSAQERIDLINVFNSPDNRRNRLFLISTRAGGVAVNLVAANRCIMLDTSWNPADDSQALFRAYRFGQTKPVYVYRLIAAGTMEETIYDRQVLKQALAHRVIDKKQIARHFSAIQVEELYTFDAYSNTVVSGDNPWKEANVENDPAFAGVLLRRGEYIKAYHDHDSLLAHQAHEDMTEEEQRAAWEDYVKEDKMPGKQRFAYSVSSLPNLSETGFESMASASHPNFRSTPSPSPLPSEDDEVEVVENAEEDFAFEEDEESYEELPPPAIWRRQGDEVTRILDGPEDRELPIFDENSLDIGGEVTIEIDQFQDFNEEDPIVRKIPSGQLVTVSSKSSALYEEVAVKSTTSTDWKTSSVEQDEGDDESTPPSSVATMYDRIREHVSTSDLSSLSEDILTIPRVDMETDNLLPDVSHEVEIRETSSVLVFKEEIWGGYISDSDDNARQLREQPPDEDNDSYVTPRVIEEIPYTLQEDFNSELGRQETSHKIEEVSSDVFEPLVASWASEGSNGVSGPQKFPQVVEEDNSAPQDIAKGSNDLIDPAMRGNDMPGRQETFNIVNEVTFDLPDPQTTFQPIRGASDDSIGPEVSPHIITEENIESIIYKIYNPEVCPQLVVEGSNYKLDPQITQMTHQIIESTSDVSDPRVTFQPIKRASEDAIVPNVSPQNINEDNNESMRPNIYGKGSNNLIDPEVRPQLIEEVSNYKLGPQITSHVSHQVIEDTVDESDPRATSFSSKEASDDPIGPELSPRVIKEGFIDISDPQMAFYPVREVSHDSICPEIPPQVNVEGSNNKLAPQVTSPVTCQVIEGTVDTSDLRGTSVQIKGVLGYSTGPEVNPHVIKEASIDISDPCLSNLSLLGQLSESRKPEETSQLIGKDTTDKMCTQSTQSIEDSSVSIARQVILQLVEEVSNDFLGSQVSAEAASQVFEEVYNDALYEPSDDIFFDAASNLDNWPIPRDENPQD